MANYINKLVAVSKLWWSHIIRTRHMPRFGYNWFISTTSLCLFVGPGAVATDTCGENSLSLGTSRKMEEIEWVVGTKVKEWGIVVIQLEDVQLVIIKFPVMFKMKISHSASLKRRWNSASSIFEIYPQYKVEFTHNYFLVILPRYSSIFFVLFAPKKSFFFWLEHLENRRRSWRNCGNIRHFFRAISPLTFLQEKEYK